ncbi:MAG TPA: DUF72 domain-containing protein [Armatimonadota bacterium]|jgi:uncharacterized protein YecE (DUF72 family)|nr:DUF72 domain-containing protein [Armatimonadota bacterium]HPP73596.1 DUF72 domain-containing protein [Armatimonadota bacterium]
MIFIGTSGFSYEDWKGHFYPADISKRDMLSYYAEHFPAVEINSTYYTVPGAAAFRSMVQRTPSDFKFAIKLHKDITHNETPDPDTCQYFIQAIDSVVSAGKLACVLAQFPWKFKPSSETISRLYLLREWLRDIPVVVEFRNSAWVSIETFRLLREFDFGYCSVDEPELRDLMPRDAISTSKTGYVRFHGRNSHEWWKHEHAWQRYNYLYNEDELQEWVPKVEGLASSTEVTYLFFNNHYQGKAAKNASMLASMLSLSFGKNINKQQSLFE